MASPPKWWSGAAYDRSPHYARVRILHIITRAKHDSYALVNRSKVLADHLRSFTVSVRVPVSHFHLPVLPHPHIPTSPEPTTDQSQLLTDPWSGEPRRICSNHCAGLDSATHTHSIIKDSTHGHILHASPSYLRSCIASSYQPCWNGWRGSTRRKA